MLVYLKEELTKLEGLKKSLEIESIKAANIKSSSSEVAAAKKEAGVIKKKIEKMMINTDIKIYKEQQQQQQQQQTSESEGATAGVTSSDDGTQQVSAAELELQQTQLQSQTQLQTSGSEDPKALSDNLAREESIQRSQSGDAIAGVTSSAAVSDHPTGLPLEGRFQKLGNEQLSAAELELQQTQLK